MLDPAFISQLDRLAILAKKMFRGKLRGEKRSRKLGHSVEFHDFRQYMPGDDIRRIDWNLYSRLEKYYLKLFVEEEDLTLYLIVDSSKSMDFGTPSKFDYSRRLAAALPNRGGRTRRVYVSRGPHGTRRLANESELLPLLERYGFEVVLHARLTLLELLAVFSEAEAILAVDAAALACLAVAPQGAQVGAIASKGIYRPRAYCISAQIGQVFTYLQAEPVFSSHAVHAECDLSLPASALEDWLRRF